MSQKSFSKFLMFTALLVVHIHACLPHEHENYGPTTISEFGVERSLSDIFQNLWHPDLGEDHLDMYENPGDGPSVNVFWTSESLNPVGDDFVRSHNEFVPWTFSLPPPRSAALFSLRAPPIFA
jgi:hypothetical protein